MDHCLIIKRQTRAFIALEKEVPKLIAEAFSHEQLNSIIENEIFTPSEDEKISHWFARYLTLHKNLWRTVETCIDNAGGMNNLSLEHDYQYFVLGYACVCLLIRMDRFLIYEFAEHTLIQRKLNEKFPKYRIKRKTFMALQKEMLKPSNAIRINQAHRILKRRKKLITKAVINSPVEIIFNNIINLEKFINLSRRDYFIAWLRTRHLSLRRRGASAKQKSIFRVLEYGGRLASELTLPRPKKVTKSICNQVSQLAQPGDIFVTRHNRALTNLFLPGYWPHAALYIDEDKINTEPAWAKLHTTFEALKDGVHFRVLEQTLNVDAFVILRPNFSDQEKQQAIHRVIQHAGKGYNFDFDFFRSDQLVCTEVIYRAYDGVNNQSIELKERMGKKTLSAEDLLDLALESDWADVIAIYGVGNSETQLLTGSSAITALKQSYKT